MSTVNMRTLSRETKSVIEEVVRSGRPAIITVNGRPQVAVTPLVGAVEAVEDHVLQNAPARIQEAVRLGEADLISGRASVVDDKVFASLPEEAPTGEALVATLAERLDTASLEEAIRSAESDPDPVAAVRNALTDAIVFAVGMPASDAAASAAGGASAVVTYPSEEDEKVVMLPVFTRVDVLQEALSREPEWQTLEVLQLSGRQLVQNVDPYVTIVIDPWSDLEFHLPPTGRRILMAEQAIIAASELVAETS